MKSYRSKQFWYTTKLGKCYQTRKKIHGKERPHEKQNIGQADRRTNIRKIEHS